LASSFFNAEEATMGFEPMIRVLQTLALPLGHVALLGLDCSKGKPIGQGKTWSKLAGIWSPRPPIRQHFESQMTFIKSCKYGNMAHISWREEIPMPIEPPFPDLDEWIVSIGEAGQRLSEIEASEGAAGNISAYLGWPVEVRRGFPEVEIIDLPLEVPELAGGTLLVSGSGRRLREIILEPAANLGALVVDPGGKTGHLYSAPRRLFTRLTSELNSHLAVHRDQVVQTGTNFHAVVHAQPLHLTYLSHIPRYQDELTLNRRLLRWQPELIVQLPDGIGLVKFNVPGSAELMAATVASLRQHRLVVWSKHGVMSRSDLSVKRAADRVEYAETGAKYECMDLAYGSQAEGLSDEQIRAICKTWNINQNIF
jgi:rhamnulose-1-phosphate aldolase